MSLNGNVMYNQLRLKPGKTRALKSDRRCQSSSETQHELTPVIYLEHVKMLFSIVLEIYRKNGPNE